MRTEQLTCISICVQVYSKVILHVQQSIWCQRAMNCWHLYAEAQEAHHTVCEAYADIAGERCKALLETYARLSQSTSPAASAALVVHTILLGVLFFSVGSSKLVKYACPKKCVPIWHCTAQQMPSKLCKRLWQQSLRWGHAQLENMHTRCQIAMIISGTKAGCPFLCLGQWH